MYSRILCIPAWLLISLASLIHAEENRHALIIGNGAYENTDALPNPPTDAKDVAAQLQGGGWRVTLVQNANVKGMVRAVREFCEAARGSDAGLFFYAGHGIEVKGQNYLLPVDAKLAEDEGEDALPLETLALDKVLADLGSADIRLKVVVLDCCRNNPLKRSWIRRRSAGGGLAAVDEKKMAEGTMLVFSTAPGQTALDGEGRNSPFTSALLKRCTAGGGSVSDIFADVAKSLGAQQSAWIRFDGSGTSFAAFRDFSLLPETAAMPTITMSPVKKELKATKDTPFVNSLGMKFVPVPGTKVLFCTHEVRRKDYQRYAESASGVNVSWNNLDVSATSGQEDEPVVMVNWEDSKSFCAWLSKNEGIGYRLPTDHEWSCAAGIGGRENATESPRSKSDKVADAYSWGQSWPPNEVVDNFADDRLRRKMPTTLVIQNYDDGYETASPVMTSHANEFGIYGMGGNVREWCYDHFDASEALRVVRGASWGTGERSELLLSHRKGLAPTMRNLFCGFRCVIEP